MALLDTSNLEQSIPQPDIIAAQDAKFVKYPAGQYDVSNPHPGYGKDPNIINEFGHTMYPKWVKPAGDGEPVRVMDAKEEAVVLGKEVEAPKPVDPTNGWTA